jgi:hypothetical protein
VTLAARGGEDLGPHGRATKERGLQRAAEEAEKGPTRASEHEKREVAA